MKVIVLFFKEFIETIEMRHGYLLPGLLPGNPGQLVTLLDSKRLTLLGECGRRQIDLAGPW